MQQIWVWSLGQDDALEKEMAPHSSLLAREIPWTEEPDGLQSRGPQGLWSQSDLLFNKITLMTAWRQIRGEHGRGTSLVVRWLLILRFHCKRSRFHPWLGNQVPTSSCAAHTKRGRERTGTGGQLGGHGRNSGSGGGRETWSTGVHCEKTRKGSQRWSNQRCHTPLLGGCKVCVCETVHFIFY